jgi:hypothetical protein
MRRTDYDDLMIRVEDDLTERGTMPIISDNVELVENSGLEGVTFIKGQNTYIFIDKNLDTFDKARTLVEEYFHAISDLGNHLDYSATSANNDEVAAREEVLAYMTDEDTLIRIAKQHPDEPFAAWMLSEHLGYPQDFSEETVSYYRRRGILS